jgi:hypothetical protein
MPKRNKVLLLLAFLVPLSLPVQKSPWYRINSVTGFDWNPTKLLDRPLEAADNDWGFVRGSASWARGNSTFIDELLAVVRDNEWLNRPGVQTFDNITLGKEKFRVKLSIEQTFTGIPSLSYEGTRTFRSKFEIFRPAQGSDPERIVLQLFFDSPESVEKNGALMYYNLAGLNPEEPAFDKDPDALVETFIFRKPDGLRRQVYTWKMEKTPTRKFPTDVGRVVLDEVLEGDSLCFRAVARFSGDILTELLAENNPSLPSLIYPACEADEEDDLYYSLAYMQKFRFPFLTTAMFGWSGTDQRKQGWCGISNINYGLFNHKGFVRDRVPADQVPASYPSPNSGDMSVNDAFGATFTENTASTGYGATGSDNTSKEFMDAIKTASEFNFKEDP